MYPVSLNNLYDELKSAHHKMLSKALERAKGLKPSLKISTELREGRPADQIVMAAEEGGFDLIVLGHRGLGKVKEFFLGSVSDRVADEARCPVLIVK
jgi:nucleotide-binding universal stress UspA family protein